MSQYYKPVRKADWNYGGPRWRLSRSKIDLYVECPRCFYIDNKLGTARPRGYPFNLNSAVDALLKKEFDIHRGKKEAHPLMIEYGVDAIPFEHRKLDIWRENFKGVEAFHPPTGFTVSGAVDDLWINPQGEIHIVDYKATSKDGEVSLDAEWQDGYKRQMEIYQWLMRQNDFAVSDTGYFVYANGRTDLEQFDGKLEFEIKVIPYTGNADWIDEKLLEIKTCLEADSIPPIGEECDYCPYREAAGKALKVMYGAQGNSTLVAKEKVTPKKSTPIKKGNEKTLFE